MVASMSDALRNGLTELGIEYSEYQLQQLMAYQNILLKWNKVFSLTAIKNHVDALTYHLLDGLSVVKYFSNAKNILDVGSGMGVPGVILAIMCPESNVVVIDSNSKKTAFLLQVKIELGLQNLQIISKRVEDYQPAELFSIITSRAFANLNLFVQLTHHLLASDGKYLAMKSELGLSEVDQVADFDNKIITLIVPNLDAQRYLIEMTHK